MIKKEDLVILECIANQFFLTDLVSNAKKRDRYIAIARFMGQKYLREKGYTLLTIGKYFGGQDHSTIINGIKKANIYLEIPILKERYDKALNGIIDNIIYENHRVCCGCWKYKDRQKYFYNSKAIQQCKVCMADKSVEKQKYIDRFKEKTMLYIDSLKFKNINYGKGM